MAERRNPRVAVDAVIISDGGVVLVRRRNPPYPGVWALPGGFMEYGETTEETCAREALEETGLTVGVERLVGVYSDPKRDPRWHTVGVAYLCGVLGGSLRGGDDAAEARRFPLAGLPELAFDHARIVSDALKVV